VQEGADSRNIPGENADSWNKPAGNTSSRV